MRPHRLAWSRTSPFHGENRGSNPLGDTILSFFVRSEYESVSIFTLWVGFDSARFTRWFVLPSLLCSHGLGFFILCIYVSLILI